MDEQFAAVPRATCVGCGRNALSLMTIVEHAGTSGISGRLTWRKSRSATAVPRPVRLKPTARWLTPGLPNSPPFTRRDAGDPRVADRRLSASKEGFSNTSRRFPGLDCLVP